METLDYIFGSPNLKIYQDTDVFHFSLDSILLSHFASVLPSYRKILDVGCGNAPISLVLSERTSAYITGVEIQKHSYLLASKSVLENQKEQQIQIVHQDVLKFAKELESDTYDLIVCNPPYFDTKDKEHLNAKNSYCIARHEGSLDLDVLFQISKKLLKNRGVLSIVHRPDRLLDILVKMRSYGIEPKRLQFVYPKHNRKANTILIEGMKCGKVGISILEPLIVHNDDGSYSDQLLKFIGGDKNEPKKL